MCPPSPTPGGTTPRRIRLKNSSAPCGAQHGLVTKRCYKARLEQGQRNMVIKKKGVYTQDIFTVYLVTYDME